jgi:cell division protein FtsB
MAAGPLARIVRRWWPVLALALLLAALQSKLWFGAGGLPDARALQQSVREQREDNARLQQRNDALGAEVEDLKSGETAVEERARSELGMIKPGETFYRVVEPHAGTAASAAPASAPPPADATTGSTSAPPATAASLHAADEAASPAGAPAGEAPPGLPTTDADTPPAASNDAPEPTP